MSRRFSSFALSLALPLVSVGCSASSDGESSGQAADTTPTVTAKHGPAIDDVSRYCDDWQGCTSSFVEAANAAIARAPGGAKTWSASYDDAVANGTDSTGFPVDVKGQCSDDPATSAQDLPIQFAFFPARVATEKLVILTSGVHGLEGFMGSTAQTLFLDAMVDDATNSANILLVHGINAYGMRCKTRVNANRVDLNRNAFYPTLEAALAQTNADGTRVVDDSSYDLYSGLLNPQGPSSFSGGILSLDFVSFGAAVAADTAPDFDTVTGRPKTSGLGKAGLQGQYHLPAGMEYGGATMQPSIVLSAAQLDPYLAQFHDVAIIDLHTGLGTKTQQLLPNRAQVIDPDGSQHVAERRAAIFDDATHTIIETANDPLLYDNYGDWSDYVCRNIFARGSDHHCVNMLLEYGTLTPVGASEVVEDKNALYSLYLLVRENQTANHGAASDDDRTAIYSEYASQFLPTDQAWRSQMLGEITTTWPTFIQKFTASSP